MRQCTRFRYLLPRIKYVLYETWAVLLTAMMKVAESDPTWPGPRIDVEIGINGECATQQMSSERCVRNLLCQTNPPFSFANSQLLKGALPSEPPSTLGHWNDTTKILAPAALYSFLNGCLEQAQTDACCRSGIRPGKSFVL